MVGIFQTGGGVKAAIAVGIIDELFRIAVGGETVADVSHGELNKYAVFVQK